MLIIFGGGWVVVLFASISKQCFKIAFENTFLMWNIFSEHENKMFFFLETLPMVRNFSLLQKCPDRFYPPASHLFSHNRWVHPRRWTGRDVWKTIRFRPVSRLRFTVAPPPLPHTLSVCLRGQNNPYHLLLKPQIL